MQSRFHQLETDIARLRTALLDHPVYEMVNTVPRLHIFMQAHVFAVWDFMSLIKRLQLDLTCASVPWRPPEFPQLARFVNEVILTEETDLGPDGTPQSHLEMYLDAMEEIDASTVQFRTFLRVFSATGEVQRALRVSDTPRYVRSFVTNTIDCAQCGPSAAVASAFLFGREDLIPDMFERLIPMWNGSRTRTPSFCFYLRRHIELDGEEHGPIARRALNDIAGDDKRAWKIANHAARRAIKHRIKLWDGVCRCIRDRERRAA